MKRQFLGDVKDAFKWDYLAFITRTLEFSHLNIIWMMTPDDDSNKGGLPPERYPARPEIIQLCKELGMSHDPELLHGLSSRTGARYTVISYCKPNEYFTIWNRDAYFSGVDYGVEKQVLFLDPDNGFEPANATDKHVSYSDLGKIMENLKEQSILVVFHHFRRINFAIDYKDICKRLKDIFQNGFYTAILWNFLMFVVITKNHNTIEKVSLKNIEYAKEKNKHLIAAKRSIVKTFPSPCFDRCKVRPLTTWPKECGKSPICWFVENAIY